jgi:16S rRNA (guanine(966)-N(2))-methyltransferase RsmD
MRIIAGQKRGMKLLSPKGDVSRPILDRVKGSLFSVLYKYDLPAGAMVADLFSGVGSLGLEALSRGAEFVTFIERDARVRVTLEKNIAKAGFVKETKVIAVNAFTTGAILDYGRPKYNLVFIDPPYPTTMDVGPESQLAGLMKVLRGQVTEDAIVSVRTDKKVHLHPQYDSFSLLERREWGSMQVSLLRRYKACPVK